jgi:hypothetical protein
MPTRSSLPGRPDAGASSSPSPLQSATAGSKPRLWRQSQFDAKACVRTVSGHFRFSVATLQWPWTRQESDMATRKELDLLLQGLEEQMPLLAGDDFEDATFWPAFWLLAEPIEDAAGAAERRYVRQRLVCLLGNYGLILCDTEGRPSSDIAA